MYTPQQNGVVERKNRTLIKMARTMLDEYKTPTHFWAEAVETACHVTARRYMSFSLVTNPKLDTFEYSAQSAIVGVKTGGSRVGGPELCV